MPWASSSVVPGAELHVQVDVAPRAGLAAAQLVEADDRRASAKSSTTSRMASSSSSGSVSSTSTREERVRIRTPATATTAATMQRDDRIEPRPSPVICHDGERHEHAERAQHVGAEVRRVGRQRRRARSPRARGRERPRDDEVHDDRHARARRGRRRGAARRCPSIRWLTASKAMTTEPTRISTPSMAPRCPRPSRGRRGATRRPGASAARTREERHDRGDQVGGRVHGLGRASRPSR